MSGLADMELRGAASPGLVTIAAAAPVIPPERALELADGPVLFWDAPAGVAAASGGRWAVAGWGEAARIEARGDDALQRAAAEGERLIAGIQRGQGEVAGAPEPRLFGGIAFLPGAQAAQEEAIAPPWGGFADASFTLPAWLYATDGERAVLRAVVPREAARATGRRLDALLAAIEARRGETEGWDDGAERAPAHAELVSPDAWRALVRDALARIAGGELDKVVLAAPSLVEAAQPIAIPRVLARLGEGYGGCARFALERGGAVFAGASPERLVAVAGRAVEADALAGSTPRRLDGDAAAAWELLASAKERREHALVVEAIAAALGPVCEAIDVPAVPAVRTLRNVHHLWSPIVGRLEAPAHLLDLARRLHPTPAVCGTPRPAAIRWIRAREPAPRGWYAGAVGWIGAGGEGALWLGIRAALIEGHRAWLYAGVGLVEGSDPDAELGEARAKRRPMLAALGAPHPFEAAPRQVQS